MGAQSLREKKNTNVSYLLSIIGGPWQKGGHMKHDFSSMELRIHRMFTSGVICQSKFSDVRNVQEIGYQDNMHWKVQLVNINKMKLSKTWEIIYL